jgi:hypothetical protein
MEHIGTAEPIKPLVQLFWRKIQQQTPETHSIPGTGSIVPGMATGQQQALELVHAISWEKCQIIYSEVEYPLILRGFPSDTYLSVKWITSGSFLFNHSLGLGPEGIATCTCM